MLDKQHSTPFLFLFYLVGGGGSLVLFIFGKLSRTSQANIKSTFKGLRDHKLGNGSALLCTLCSLPVCCAAVWRPQRGAAKASPSREQWWMLGSWCACNNVASNNQTMPMWKKWPPKFKNKLVLDFSACWMWHFISFSILVWVNPVCNLSFGQICTQSTILFCTFEDSHFVNAVSSEWY